MKFRHLLLTAAILAAGAAPVLADDTVTTTTTVKQIDLPGVKKFDLASFDDNHDGVITVEEAGDHLFHLFDLDSNGVLDNHEFYKKTIITVMPLKEQTVTFRDSNGDGQVESKTYSQSTFLEHSGLAAFAGNKDGMSAADFVHKSFLQMDTNHDHVIDAAEWRAAYVESHIPKANQQFRYND